MWFLVIHGILAIWVFIDGLRRKAGIILWVIGVTILGPILLPVYIARRPLRAGEFPKSERTFKWLRNFAVFWTVLLILVSMWSQKKDINGAVENETLEYRLAVINSGNCVPKNDVAVDRFRSLLDQLSTKCIEDRQQIANISVIARNKIKKNGMDESLLNIMNDLNNLFYEESGKEKYAKYIFAYIGLRNNGLSHNDAIERLHAIIEGY